MENTGDYTLWSDVSRENFFLVPGDEILSAGNLEIRTITGNSMQVNPDEINRFSVSREEAKQWLKSEFASVIDEAKQAFLESLKKDRNEPPDWSVTAKRKKEEQANNVASSREQEKEKEPNPAEHEAHHGNSLHDLDSLTAFLDKFGSLVERSISTAKQPNSDTHAQAEELRNLLQGYGMNVGGDTESFFDRIQDWLSAQESSAGLQESARNLEELAEKIDAAANRSSNRLRSMAETMRKHPENKR